MGSLHFQRHFFEVQKVHTYMLIHSALVDDGFHFPNVERLRFSWFPGFLSVAVGPRNFVYVSSSLSSLFHLLFLRFKRSSQNIENEIWSHLESLQNNSNIFRVLHPEEVFLNNFEPGDPFSSTKWIMSNQRSCESKIFVAQRFCKSWSLPSTGVLHHKYFQRRFVLT